MLGRQRWIGTRKVISGRFLRQTLKDHMPGITEDDLVNPDNPYSETFFTKLGFQSVDSMDMSDFEGATIIQDLAGPLDESLENRFDVIYDGGTCEHIFNVPQAFANIDKMLRPGGVLIGHARCNNWINHGFFQFSPELVYGYWEKAMGYELLHLTLQPILPAHFAKTSGTTNPNKTGRRPRLQRPLPVHSPVIMNYAVRKPRDKTAAPGDIYQSDYQTRWDTGEPGGH